jgi:hypothetical protein
MKLLYMSPRLDIGFKPDHVPAIEGPPNHPVRLYYVEFEKRMKEFASKFNHELVILKKPMWEFKPEDIDEHEADVAFMTHREHHDFPHPKVLYCMQMGLPWLFSIDKQGWCAGASDWPLPYKEEINNDNIVALRNDLVSKNVSKFQQVNKKIDLPKDFILFTCQLPHDTTISNHSNISVNDALIRTIEFAKTINIPIVVKGHPINLGSMAPLVETFKQHGKAGDMWVNEANIHQCLSECIACFTVNSGGTGLEAIIHEKPIFIFGRTDFQSVALDGSNVETLWEDRDKMIKHYPSFLDNYYNTRYNVMDTNTFDKLECVLQ